MFGKKKVVNEINAYDNHMNTLRNELAEIGWEMDKKVKDAYIKSQAIALYMENTPDWEQAVADRNAAQIRLRCSIGAYDSKRAEIIRYSESYKDKFEQSWSVTVESHVKIERELAFILGTK